MKNNIKISCLIMLIVIFLCTTVHANFAVFYSDRLNITVSNINDEIEKVELISLEDCVPSELFGYDIDFIEGEEERLYKLTDYDRSKYILIKLGDDYKEYVMNGIYHSTYYDSNKNLFAFYKIKTTNEIDNIKINDGVFKLAIEDLKLYSRKDFDYSSEVKSPDFCLRFYKENEEFKDIPIGDNGYETTDYGSISILSKNFDYQTGQQLNIEKNSRFIEDTIILVIEIGIAMLLTIIIELLVAKRMGISNYNNIIKVNIITQLVFHLVFLIPQTYLGISIVTILMVMLFSIINSSFIALLLSVVVLELVIVLIEYKMYKKSIQEDAKKILKYAFLANSASFFLSFVVFFTSILFS